MQNQYVFAFTTYYDNRPLYTGVRADGSIYQHNEWPTFFREVGRYCDGNNQLVIGAEVIGSDAKVYRNRRYLFPFVYVYTQDNKIASLRFLKDSELIYHSVEIDPEERYYNAVAAWSERFSD